MWRISGDHWDGWTLPAIAAGSEYPFGLDGAFDRLAKWFAYTGPGSWPDADMLPEGWLGPHPGLGEPRQSRETPDEQRTEFTLWAVVRSPLILGGNLTRLDDFTRSLITNQNILFVDQNATYSRPIDASALGPGFENIRVWRATINEPGARGYAEFFAFFNLSSGPATVRTTWKDLGLDNLKHSAQNAWDDSTTKESKDLTVTLPAHGCALYQIIQKE
jgi:hypothetical protein